MDKSIYSFTSPRPQRFSFPTDVISYLINNCVSSIVWQRLQKTCKYFFSKKKVVVTRAEGYDNFYWRTVREPHLYGFAFNKTLKYWLTNNLRFSVFTQKNFLNYIYRCNLNKLIVERQNLAHNEICLLLNGKEIATLYLSHIKIQYEDETPVTMDAIIKQCPKLTDFYYSNISEHFSTNSFLKLNQLKIFPHLSEFELIISHLDDEINPETFVNFLKKYLDFSSKAEIMFRCNFPNFDFFEKQVKDIIGPYWTKFAIRHDFP